MLGLDRCNLSDGMCRRLRERGREVGCGVWSRPVPSSDLESSDEDRRWVHETSMETSSTLFTLETLRTTTIKPLWCHTLNIVNLQSSIGFAPNNTIVILKCFISSQASQFMFLCQQKSADFHQTLMFRRKVDLNDVEIRC